MCVGPTAINVSSNLFSAREFARANVLEQIIAVDQERILVRLRSRHATSSKKTEFKNSLIELLHGAVNHFSLPVVNLMTSPGRETHNQVSIIYKAFQQLEKWPENSRSTHAFQKQLVDVVTLSSQLDTSRLNSLLKKAPKLDPSLRKSLPQAIGKITRYVEIAVDLVNAARGTSRELFEHISVECLQPPTILSLPVQADYHAALARITEMKKRAYISRYPLTNLPTLEATFKSRVHRLGRKVHAEIQLLLYYEEMAIESTRRPRIICSSKDACYMCDLFVRSHGIFHMPSTHGAMYDLWTLPTQLELNNNAKTRVQNALRLLNVEIESKIKRTLNKSAQPFAQPNESNLFSREPFTSTSTLAKTILDSGQTTPKAASIHTVRSSQPSENGEATPTGQEDATWVTHNPSLQDTESTTSTVRATPQMPEPETYETHRLVDITTTYSFRSEQTTLNLQSAHIKVSASYNTTSRPSPQQDTPSPTNISATKYSIRASSIHLGSKEDHAPLSGDGKADVEYVDVRRLPNNGERMTLEAGSYASSATLALKKGRSVILLKFVGQEEDQR